MKIAYIMRGIPGSGKSTVARQLVSGGRGIIHSTDELRTVKGKYIFDPQTDWKKHQRNLELFCKSLKEGVPIVVCDNTNVKKSQYGIYVTAAKAAGYMVAIVSMPHPNPEEAAARNTHGVPIHAIKKMILDWEA